MMVKAYLRRIYDSILSRGYIGIEHLVFDDMSDQRGSIEGRLRFFDGSLLVIDEVIIWRDNHLVKLRYAYHYQDVNGVSIFRYDNAPHFSDLATYPHHKHVGAEVFPSLAPDLGDVLSEIDQLVFKRQLNHRPPLHQIRDIITP